MPTARARLELVAAGGYLYAKRPFPDVVERYGTVLAIGGAILGQDGEVQYIPNVDALTIRPGDLR